MRRAARTEDLQYAFCLRRELRQSSAGCPCALRAYCEIIRKQAGEPDAGQTAERVGEKSAAGKHVVVESFGDGWLLGHQNECISVQINQLIRIQDRAAK